MIDLLLIHVFYSFLLIIILSEDLSTFKILSSKFFNNTKSPPILNDKKTAKTLLLARL